MGDRERRENAQREKCLETDISSTTLNALDAFKDKDCDPGFLIYSRYHSLLTAKKIL